MGWGGDSDRRRSRALSRRDFLRYSASLPLGASIWLQPFDAFAGDALGPKAWPQYALRRERDERFLKLIAVGFRETRLLGSRWLSPVKAFRDRYLIFEFPPQHFAEVALVPKSNDIPLVFAEDQLAQIRLTASAPSEVVFRIRARRPVRLRVEDLLACCEFELVLPDLESAAQKYDLEVARSHSPPATRIKMPWGIELSPTTDTAPSNYTFDDPRQIKSAGPWTELWTASLKRKTGPSEAIPLEVLSVRGFDKLNTQGTVDQGTLEVTYGDHPGIAFPPQPTPLSKYSRIDVAGSLSRRFPYTGKITPLLDTGVIKYLSNDPNQSGCVAACFVPGRAIPAKQVRLSARGGWLQLEGKWDPFPGCAPSRWIQSTSLGRDHHVEVINEGFFYPFCTPCELAELKQRKLV